jgi:Sulfotransferase domain
MAEPPSAAAGVGFDPLALHRHNINMLRGGDVLVAGYPGSGASLLGNMLLELGLEHVDPYTEQLTVSGAARPVPERLAYRDRLAAVSARDAADDRGRGRARPDSGVRFVKTHLLPEAFAERAGHRVVLLARDPRDAIHSYYHWRIGFSEEGEDRSFEEFLREPGPLTARPVPDWTRFYRLWGEHAPKPYLITFECLKAAPLAALRGLLRAFGMARSTADLAAAVERSSFAAMRRHEDAHAAAGGPGRIMRRGMPGEWREWYRGDIVRYFSEPAFLLVARDLGYQL